MQRSWFGPATSFALALALGLTGCKDEPEPRGSGGDESGAPARAGSVRSEGIGQRELDLALTEFLQKVDQRAAQGWPAELAVSEPPARPLVRIEVTNETTGRIDKDAWAGSIADQLVARGTLCVVLAPADGGAPGDALALACRVSEERSEADGVRTVDRWIHLLLSGGPDRHAFASTRMKFRTQRER